MINATSKLQLEAAEVRNNKPNWISYLRSQLVPNDEYTFITAFEAAKTKAERDEVLNRDRTNTAKCIIGLITDVARDQLIRYVLTVFDDFLQEDKGRAEIFHEYARKTKQSTWYVALLRVVLSLGDYFDCRSRFQGILTRNDNFIVNIVSGPVRVLE